MPHTSLFHTSRFFILALFAFLPVLEAGFRGLFASAYSIRRAMAIRIGNLFLH
jgi:hypothetical protein